jgi:hypothetical protein
LSFEAAPACQAEIMRFGSRWALGRSGLISQFDSEFSNALLEFNRETVVYCQGISDIVARDYATNYARMLRDRMQGNEFSLPRIPVGLFEPNRNLIRATLERMCKKHFQSK